ncbi:DsbA family oxidoreductase [Oceanicoccus sagamiensis]|uniref:DSBA-like thioredoxin domain-containing protein n=1 Tax=Oceanicoccus sagamiensis TaxID=716816 RepID=A0A1X9NA35_9GAMM|nr:DsbA family oxidoreductase [Oceanicoccus sagamiensis]ARN74920.1 hypothetical protein BST96_12830 [Oceanicoccus sagamiensis]
MSQQQPIKIEVVSDYVCPWCYVGKRRLEKALAQRPDLAVEVSFRPFQLNPDMPREGKDRKAHMISIFGAERAETIMGSMGEIGREEGITIAYKEGSRSPNTLSAHVISQLALEHGKQDAMSEALFKAFFTDCDDIGDSDVLTRLAVEVGLDRATVTAALANADAEHAVIEGVEVARQQGVTGVPFFIIDNRYGLSGAQPADTLVEVLDKVTQEVA